MKFSFFAAIATSALAMITGCASNGDEAPQNETEGKLGGFGAPATAVVLNGADATHLFEALMEAGVDPVHGSTGNNLKVRKIKCIRYYDGTAEDYGHRCSIDEGSIVGDGQPMLLGQNAKALIELLETKAGVKPKQRVLVCVVAPCPESNVLEWSTGEVVCSSSFLGVESTQCSVTVATATPPDLPQK